jgi:hypothetical protein
MDVERESFWVDEERIEAVVQGLADRRFFQNPTTIESQSQLLDEIREDLPGLFSLSEKLIQVLSDDPSQGWNQEQIRLLATGVDMSLLVLHELMTQNQ